MVAVVGHRNNAIFFPSARGRNEGINYAPTKTLFYGQMSRTQMPTHAFAQNGDDRVIKADDPKLGLGEASLAENI